MNFIFLLIISSFYAQEKPWYFHGKSKDIPTFENCKTDAKYFSKNFNLDKFCFFAVLPYANARLQMESDDKQLFVLAFNNAIYINEKENNTNGLQINRRIIAGSKTSLNNIQSIDISPDNKWIVVLDKNTAKIFPSARHGNVGPNKVIKHKALIGATNIKFHPDEEHLIVLNNKEPSVFFLSTQWDSRHPAQEKQVNATNKIFGNKTLLSRPADAIVSLDEEELYILDTQQESVLVYDLNKSGDLAPKRNIANNGDLFKPFKFSYDKVKKTFKIINHDYSVKDLKK